MAALSGALAGVVALSGVGVAASRSGPGDVFYAAKRTAESVRLGVSTGDPSERGLRRLQLATTRLSELESLSESGRTIGLAGSTYDPARPLAGAASRAQVLEVLDDMDEDVRDGSRLMLDAYADDGDTAPLVVLQGWSVEQAARLRALLPRLSSAVQPRGEGSLALVRAGRGRGGAAAGRCPRAGPGDRAAGRGLADAGRRRRARGAPRDRARACPPERPRRRAAPHLARRRRHR